MSAIDISTPKTILNTGVLQLQNGVAMSSTLVSVTDQSNTASQLKLSTDLTQIAGTLQIHTDTATYIDAEDGSGNNRFTISRDPSSQQVNVDFASKPTDLTTVVGALRTYADGTNLSESLRFQENGNAIANYLGVAGGANSSLSTLHLGGSQVFQVGNPVATNQYMVIDSVSGSQRGIRFGNQGTLRMALIQNANDLQIGDFVTTFSPFVTFKYNSGGYTGFGETNPTARLQIKGSGSTSATTSLLVQNSSAVNSLMLKDNGDLTTYGLINIRSQAGDNGGNIYTAATENLILSSTAYGTGSAVNINTNGVIIQRLGTNANAHISSVLDVRSTTQGFLPPRMTNAQRLAIATPAVGLMVYCTDAVEGLYVYKSTGWTFVI